MPTYTHTCTPAELLCIPPTRPPSPCIRGNLVPPPHNPANAGQQLAVKIVRIPADNEIFIKRLTREVKILREIDHQNIVHLHKVSLSPPTLQPLPTVQPSSPAL